MNIIRIVGKRKSYDQLCLIVSCLEFHGVLLLFGFGN